MPTCFGNPTPSSFYYLILLSSFIGCVKTSSTSLGYNGVSYLDIEEGTFTIGEVKEAIRKTRNGKATGIDHIIAEVLKQQGHVPRSTLMHGTIADKANAFR